MTATSHNVEQHLRGLRIVPATLQNAQRLLACYNKSFRDDADVLQRICSEQAGVTSVGIDGLTEPRTVSDFETLLGAPETVTLEVPDPLCAEGPPLAFVIVRYASTENASINRFRNYFLGEVFDPGALAFVGTDAEAEFHATISRGNVVYLAEFVSAADSAATLAVMVAAQVVVVERILGIEIAGNVGKCLESASVGNSVNRLGNVPIKKLAASLGMAKVATAIQLRKFSHPSDLTAASHREPDHVVLTFGLYLGSTDVVRRFSAPWKHLLPPHEQLPVNSG